MVATETCIFSNLMSGERQHIGAINQQYTKEHTTSNTNYRHPILHNILQVQKQFEKEKERVMYETRK